MARLLTERPYGEMFYPSVFFYLRFTGRPSFFSINPPLSNSYSLPDKNLFPPKIFLS